MDKLVSPINRLAAGMLGLLDIKSMGDTPSSLGSLLQPSLDFTEFYRWQGRQWQASASFNAAAVGGVNSTLAVPERKLWIVESFMCSTPVLGAGQALQLAPMIFAPAPNLTSLMQGEISPVFGVGDGAHARWGESMYVGCLPGYNFGAVVTRIAAGPIAVTLKLVYTEVDY